MKPLRPDELPPCFIDANGDISISMPYVVCAFDFGTVEMRTSSDKLIAVSPYFAITLKPEWLHNKITGTEDCGDGSMRTMKRYELELDKDGKDILVGKTAATDPKLRIVSGVATIQTSNLASPIPMRDANDRLNTMSTINLLGFSMLCGFPEQTDHLLMERLRQCVRVVPWNDIVHSLLGWIDYYGTLAGVRERLVRFIFAEVPGREIWKSTLLYLRLACVLRDSSFFIWVLDKNPLFSEHHCLQLSSLDNRLGLGFWTSTFERRLNFLGSEFRLLRNIPDRISPANLDKATNIEWKLFLCAWKSWLLDRAAGSQSSYSNVNSSILAMHSIATIQDIMPYYKRTIGTSATKGVRQYLQHALILAREQVAQHITVDNNEFLGFRSNGHQIFPWSYRIDDDTDETLFNLIATSDPVAVEDNLTSSC